MLKQVKIFDSSDSNVKKFVFEFEGSKDPLHKGTRKSKDAAVEAVLYKYNSYEERTVICCSTQCGCPIGCSFCGTGEFYVRNLTAEEIVDQVQTALNFTEVEINKIKRLQIMFMSMGEPFLNYKHVENAIKRLNYYYPNAELLISTSMPPRTTLHYGDFLDLAANIDKVGIQFSVHESTDENRRKIIPTLTSELRSIGFYGEMFAKRTGRKPFFNYCVHEGNNTEQDVKNLMGNFNRNVWEVTLSVICEKDNTVKNSIEQKIDLITNFSKLMVEKGYSVRLFNPAGQDDIGGGCGQLWYFQEWLNKQK